jgi:hypothetical protein
MTLEMMERGPGEEGCRQCYKMTLIEVSLKLHVTP